MPTDSIFHDFIIDNEEAVERFLDALDKASQQPKWEPRVPYRLIDDPEEIRKFFAKKDEE